MRSRAVYEAITHTLTYTHTHTHTHSQTHTHTHTYKHTHTHSHTHTHTQCGQGRTNTGLHVANGKYTVLPTAGIATSKVGDLEDYFMVTTVGVENLK